MKEGQRSFKLVFSDNKKDFYYIGRYISKSPGRAVRKAFTSIKNILKDPNKKTLLVLKETTQGSKKSPYIYIVKRVKKDKPVVLKLGNKTIKKEYDIKIEKVPTKITKEKLNKMLGGSKDLLKNLMKNKKLMKTVSKVDIESLLN